MTDDLAKTEGFYSNLLGFTVGARPDFSFPGLWLYIDETPILHVMYTKTMPKPRKGVLDHMAFRGTDVNALLQTLTQAGLTYRLVRAPDPWVLWQVFFEDPNGAVVEVDFDGREVLNSEYKLSPKL